MMTQQDNFDSYTYTLVLCDVSLACVGNKSKLALKILLAAFSSVQKSLKICKDQNVNPYETLKFLVRYSILQVIFYTLFLILFCSFFIYYTCLGGCIFKMFGWKNKKQETCSATSLSSNLEPKNKIFPVQYLVC